MINPGILKHKISFFSNEIKIDAEGFKTGTLSEIMSTKCCILKSTFTDGNKSTSKNIDSTITLINCILRYDKRINENCIVELRGKTFRIKSLENENYSDDVLKLVLQSG